MIDRAGLAVLQQVLLADIGGVARITVLGEQVVERLLAGRADFLGDRFVPFLAVGEDRIDIENHPAKIEQLVAHDVADAEPRAGAARRIDVPSGGGGIVCGAIHSCQYRACPPTKQRQAALVPRNWPERGRKGLGNSAAIG